MVRSDRAQGPSPLGQTGSDCSWVRYLPSIVPVGKLRLPQLSTEKNCLIFTQFSVKLRKIPHSQPDRKLCQGPIRQDKFSTHIRRKSGSVLQDPDLHTKVRRYSTLGRLGSVIQPSARSPFFILASSPLAVLSCIRYLMASTREVQNLQLSPTSVPVVFLKNSSASF